MSPVKGICTFVWSSKFIRLISYSSFLPFQTVEKVGLAASFEGISSFSNLRLFTVLLIGQDGSGDFNAVKKYFMYDNKNTFLSGAYATRPIASS